MHRSIRLSLVEKQAGGHRGAVYQLAGYINGQCRYLS
jgi:hypothetical protein